MNSHDVLVQKPVANIFLYYLTIKPGFFDPMYAWLLLGLYLHWMHCAERSNTAEITICLNFFAVKGKLREKFSMMTIEFFVLLLLIVMKTMKLQRAA